MKFLGLIWAGVWRKPGRTILTSLSILNAFILLGLLQGFSGGLAKAVSDTRADILLVGNRLSQLEPLPSGIAADIARVPGVQIVTPVILFQSTLRAPSQIIRAYAVQPDAFFRAAAASLSMSAEQLGAFRETRNGAVVSTELARQYGWKIGDRVPLNSSLWPSRDGTMLWPVDVVGIFTPKSDDMLLNKSMLVNYDYVDQGRATRVGTANMFVVKVADPNRAPQVAEGIDAQFANSSHETDTVTEREIAEGQLRQIGDINLVVRAIVSAVFVALLLTVGSILSQSLRERGAEFAVLKTLGFTDQGVLMLILAETLVTCLVPASAGLLIAWRLFPLIANNTGFEVSVGPTIFTSLVFAVLLALIAGGFPAVRGMRLKIVDALANR